MLNTLVKASRENQKNGWSHSGIAVLVVNGPNNKNLMETIFKVSIKKKKNGEWLERVIKL